MDERPRDAWPVGTKVETRAYKTPGTIMQPRLCGYYGVTFDVQEPVPIHQSKLQERTVIQETAIDEKIAVLSSRISALESRLQWLEREENDA